MRVRGWIVAVVIVVVAGLIIGGIALQNISQVSIEDIKNHPATYEGRIVTVSGKIYGGYYHMENENRQIGTLYVGSSYITIDNIPRSAGVAFGPIYKVIGIVRISEGVAVLDCQEVTLT